MPRRDDLYLADILEAAGYIRQFLEGLSQTDFMASELVRSAVLQKLTVIGEASNRLSKDLRDQHADVPWGNIVGMRNILVHAYHGVDWSIVWRAATVEVPRFSHRMAQVLDATSPQSRSQPD